jgi:hypothetical protein
MSSTKTIDFANVIICDENRDNAAYAELDEFTRACARTAIKDLASTNQTILKSAPEIELINEHTHLAPNDKQWAELAANVVQEGIRRSMKIHRTAVGSRFKLQIRRDEDGISYELYLWLLQCCLSHQPFKLRTITSTCFTDCSREGLGIHTTTYSPDDFEIT